MIFQGVRVGGISRLSTDPVAPRISMDWRPDVCPFSPPPACTPFCTPSLNSHKSAGWVSISLITDKVVVVVVVVVARNIVSKLFEAAEVNFMEKVKRKTSNQTFQQLQKNASFENRMIIALRYDDASANLVID